MVVSTGSSVGEGPMGPMGPMGPISGRVARKNEGERYRGEGGKEGREAGWHRGREKGGREVS